MALVERSQMLTFERGLNREFDVAEPGAARNLINFEPTPYGGLKVRRQWKEASKTGLPVDRNLIGAVLSPVHAGYDLTWMREQRRGRSRGSAVTSVRSRFRQKTQKGSYLVAILSYVNYNADGTHTATSAITVTAPAGWVPLATVHGNDAPSSISLKFFGFPDGGDREDFEVFTFGDPVRRARLNLMEIRGVDSNPLDKIKSASGFSTIPDTDISEQTTVEKEIAIGAIAARTKDRSIKQEKDSITPGWVSHYDPGDPPHASVGGRDEWLNMMTARFNLVQTQTVRLASILGESQDEDDAKSRWVAGLITLKAHLRSANDKDWYIVDHAKSDTEHELWMIDRDELASGAWSLMQGNFSWGGITPVGVIPGNTTNNRLKFAAGMGVVLMSSPDVDPALRERSAVWDGTLMYGLHNRLAAASLAFWKNRFWAGGIKEQPNRLFWSALGDPTTWIIEGGDWPGGMEQAADLPGGPGFIDVGNASEWLWDIHPVNEGMLIAQRDGLHFLSGPVSSPQSVTLAGGGGMPGKCICAIPGGAIIAGYEHIWIWQGGAPQILSRALDDWWINADRAFVYTAFVNGKVYISGAQDDTCVVYDLAQEAWWIDKPPLPPQFLYSYDGRELLTGYDSNVRAVDFQLHPDGARSRDVAAAETFEVLTHELMLGSPARPATPKWLHIAYQKRDTQAGHPPLIVTPIYDGIARTPREVTYTHAETGNVRGDGDHRIRVDVGVIGAAACHKVQYKAEWAPGADQTTVFDIEGMELIYDIEEMR